MIAQGTTIISAVVVTLRYPAARVCAGCLRPILFRSLRVCEKDAHGIAVYYYHPSAEEVDEIRACAPDVEIVRRALRQRRTAQ